MFEIVLTMDEESKMETFVHNVSLIFLQYKLGEEPCL